MGTTEESIKTVIEALFVGFERETIEGNRDAYEKLKTLYNEKQDRFFDLIEMGFYDFNTLVDAVIDVSDQKNKYILQFINNGIYEHFHKTRIKKLEGSACCADKSSFIKRMTLKALKEGENQSLYDDYTQTNRIKEDKERQAYWSPKTVKDTDEAMELFWNWYQLKE